MFEKKKYLKLNDIESYKIFPLKQLCVGYGFKVGLFSKEDNRPTVYRLLLIQYQQILLRVLGGFIKRTK